ncbi:MAG: molecular chaperone HscC [Oscillospiraceae bacterium]|nr:molecular chaperone HscC [Oscillospiraceae bacterium]
MAIIGIDLGTTNSLAVCYRNGKAEIIKSSLGDKYTPSVVSIDDNGDILVGRIAKERLISHPEVTVSEFKRIMGMRKDIKLGNKSFSPEELSSLVLRKIKEDAEAYLGEEVIEAVISVPAYFDDNCRNATKLAAQIAGLKVERLVNEPSAAALAYQAGHDFEDGTYMVIDFGGGTLDVSIVDSFDSVMEILAVAGNNHLGGKDFNDAIADYFCKTNELDKAELSADDMAIIYKLAEDCKMTLTSQPAALMIANIQNKQYSLALDNNKLIEISSEIFEQMSVPIRKALRDSRCTIDDINDIILVGGSCKMPTVQAFIEKITGMEPCTDINPDTAIAVGAGIFAGIKDRNDKLKDIILTDICPFSLGTDVLDERSGEKVMSFIIERNSPLPTSREEIYCAASEGQRRALFNFYQGESRIPEKNLYLGQLEVSYPVAHKGEQTCRARMTYDINGILVVDVTTIADNKHYSKVILSKSNNMTQADIDMCVKRMEKLKISPADKEENRLLIARAERIYEEALTEERDLIGALLSSFIGALKSQNNKLIRTEYERLSNLLDKLDY